MRIIGLTIIEDFWQDEDSPFYKDEDYIIKLNIPDSQPELRHSIGNKYEYSSWESFFSDEQLFDLEKDGYIKLIVV